MRHDFTPKKQKIFLITFVVVFIFLMMSTRKAAYADFDTRKQNFIDSDYLPLRVYNFLENGNKTFKNIKLYKNESLFYVDYWRSHWCSYYNDRDFLLSPRINEFLHLARSRGFRIFHLHWKGHEKKLDEKIRSKYKEIGKKYELPIIRDTWPDNTAGNNKYIPGFQDKCMYPGYERFGKTRCQKQNPAISVGEDDAIAYNFKSIATVARYLNAKTVILTGVHTNLCIRSAVMYLALVNISVGYIDDLLDAGFYYPTQKNHVKSHSEMNSVVLKFSEKKYGWGINSQDVMRELWKLQPTNYEPNWVLYPESARSFRRFYKQ
ncbi:hypothetical protein M9Y10_008633 [Tritrichomonas musculus]|uniref:Isochorismatase-like domain-containing protein n=1 Tax=Tritrichomonas musculus TaxID=1915356 RepID=A0ABR2IZL4_9EUKA